MKGVELKIEVQETFSGYEYILKLAEESAKKLCGCENHNDKEESSCKTFRRN